MIPRSLAIYGAPERKVRAEHERTALEGINQFIGRAAAAAEDHQAFSRAWDQRFKNATLEDRERAYRDFLGSLTDSPEDRRALNYFSEIAMRGPQGPLYRAYRGLLRANPIPPHRPGELDATWQRRNAAILGKRQLWAAAIDRIETKEEETE